MRGILGNIKSCAPFIGNNMPPTNYSFMKQMIGHKKKWFGSTYECSKGLISQCILSI